MSPSYTRSDGRGSNRWRCLTPISPPQVKYVDLLPPVVLVNSSATAERDPGRVVRLSGLRFQHWRDVADVAPNTY